MISESRIGAVNQPGGPRLCLEGQAQRVERAMLREGSGARRAGRPLRLVLPHTAAVRFMKVERGRADGRPAFRRRHRKEGGRRLGAIALADLDDAIE